eukprot:scaffold31922_cov24-Tisochrysis_lutea.AAC.1
MVGVNSRSAPHATMHAVSLPAYNGVRPLLHVVTRSAPLHVFKYSMFKAKEETAPTKKGRISGSQCVQHRS